MVFNDSSHIRNDHPFRAVGAILPDILSAEQMAIAILRASESTGCVIGEHVAAPRLPADKHCREAVETAIDFLVPPHDLALFAQAMDHHLMSLCPAYATGRYGGLLEMPLVRLVPAGTVHQWRHIWKKSQRCPLGWSTTRDSLDGVLHQQQVGWRELDA